MKTCERIGRCEFVPFQKKDGTVEQKLMYPLVDEFGGVIRWLSLEAGREFIERKYGKGVERC